MVPRDNVDNALSDLKARYEETDVHCGDCGYEDQGGTWQVSEVDREVRFRHVCPSCGAVQTRVLKLEN